MSDLVNEFALSHSSIKSLNTCARQFYWSGHGSWGGWEHTAQPETRLAYALKNGQSLDAHVGNIVHRVALDLVLAASAGMPEPQRDYLSSEALKKFRNKVLVGSTDAWKTNPKRAPMLLDAFYQDPSLPDRLVAAEEKLTRALIGLYGNVRLEKMTAAMRDGTAKLLVAEQLGRVIVDVGGEPVKVWVVVDMAVWHKPSGKVVIVDWKTGKPSAIDDAQLGLYALWLRDAEKVPIDRTSLVRIYLVARTEEARPATEADAVTATESIRVALAQVRAFLVDGDIRRNAPLSKEAFPKLEEGSHVCRRCDFRRLCSR